MLEGGEGVERSWRERGELEGIATVAPSGKRF